MNRRNNSIANPTVDEKCRKHPNKERYAFAKKSSLNKKISDDLATPMEVVPDENLSVEKQLPAMAKQPALVVVETIQTLPTVVKFTPMDDVHDPNTSNESELNITTEETVNENAEITSTAQSSSTTDESIWNFKPNFITYFTFVSQMELPDGWIWSFNQAKNDILCIYTDPLSNGTVTVKAILFRNSQEVSYHLNGKNIAPNSIPTHFSSMEDISNLIRNFHEKNICVVFDANGVIRSGFCKILMEKKTMCEM
ncbi:uncharacterized protein LOC123470325 isoform X2 [Daphnia magna]|uniref:uncharacterized protein LOC123470325 isoform X2 n=1 Tax=Daphnia magna TaxID=35525 RepID=UPI001E1BD55C|nr:uncharacterized protein LOC123470325 isoform X2 [Daphnia magna]